jgi:hypothetical protein
VGDDRHPGPRSPGGAGVAGGPGAHLRIGSHGVDRRRPGRLRAPVTWSSGRSPGPVALPVGEADG